MRISRFFIVFTLVFLIELVLLGIMTHPTVPLVFLCGLSALASLSLPWYSLMYLLMGVSLMSFIQNFSIIFTVVSCGFAMMLSVLFRDKLEHHLIIQSALVSTFGIVFMGLACLSCLTISNICVTILVVPFMIKFLQ